MGRHRRLAVRPRCSYTLRSSRWPDGRSAGLRPGGEESPGSTETRCRVTPGGGDPRDSATESKPPGSGRVRVKGCGKSAPRGRQRSRHGKPHREQDRIGAGRFMGNHGPTGVSACRPGWSREATGNRRPRGMAIPRPAVRQDTGPGTEPGLQAICRLFPSSSHGVPHRAGRRAGQFSSPAKENKRKTILRSESKQARRPGFCSGVSRRLRQSGRKATDHRKSIDFP